jgi:propanol-preferring alcohol dehydrogenase
VCVPGRLETGSGSATSIEVRTPALIFGTRSMHGYLTGTAIENEDNVRFAQQHGIHSLNEVLPLSEAPKAYERMLSGEVRFRAALDTRS